MSTGKLNMKIKGSTEPQDNFFRFGDPLDSMEDEEMDKLQLDEDIDDVDYDSMVDRDDR